MTVVFVGFELGGGDEGFDAELDVAGLEVLAEGDDVAAGSVEVSDGFFYLELGFAKAEHDA